MSIKKFAEEFGLKIITETAGRKRHPGKILYDIKGNRLKYDYYYGVQGTYNIVFEGTNEILYTGSSDNMGQRINNHFKPSQSVLSTLLKTKLGKKLGIEELQNNLKFILLSNNPDDENKMINKYKPLLNKNKGRGWWK